MSYYPKPISAYMIRLALWSFEIGIFGNYIWKKYAEYPMFYKSNIVWKIVAYKK
jgi:hypothetical protein